MTVLLVRFFLHNIVLAAHFVLLHRGTADHYASTAWILHKVSHLICGDTADPYLIARALDHVVAQHSIVVLGNH